MQTHWKKNKTKQTFVTMDDKQNGYERKEKKAEEEKRNTENVFHLFRMIRNKREKSFEQNKRKIPTNGLKQFKMKRKMDLHIVCR